MGNKELSGFFEDYMKQESLFFNKKPLQSNYIPTNIPHREIQIQQIAGILAPALKGERPSNILLYGKTGTGKTVSIKHITSEIQAVAEKNKLNLKIIYLNCKLGSSADTEYRVWAILARELGEEVPKTGLPTNEIFNIFRDALEKRNTLLVLILDEVDQLVNKAGGEILYSLVRLNSELKNSEICMIGIANELQFTDEIDSRVKSSLSEEVISFPPYNAIEINGILTERANIAFRKNTLGEGVIGKCAALAAREHGDARRALELLRIAGELAERKNENKVLIQHIDEAEEKIEKDTLIENVETLPKQFKITLYAILSVCLKSQNPVFTGDVYDIYKDYCFKCGLRPLTQRRVSDIIAELDMTGIIQTKVISKGRYGRTRKINIGMPPSVIPKVNTLLKDNLNL